MQKLSKDPNLQTRYGWVAYSTNNLMGGPSTWRLHRPGSAWLSQHFWEHFAYTQDTVFLRERAFPLLRELVQYWESHLIRNKDGKLITPDGWSPEHGPFKNAEDKKPYPGVSYDQQIVHDLFSNYIDAARVLNSDQAYRLKVEQMRVDLLGPQVGRWGQLQEWMEDWDDSTDTHRHVSHLFAVHPGRQITPRKTPDWAKAAKISLAARGENSTGWSTAWKLNMWARLGEGEWAHRMIKTLLRPAKPGLTISENSGVYPNLFDAHPPFQIDGNFGYVSGVAEMLLQSHEDFIQLLPALPLAWRDGEIRGIRARGNLTMDLKWKEGLLFRCLLKASTNSHINIRYGDKFASIDIKAGLVYILDENLRIIGR